MLSRIRRKHSINSQSEFCAQSAVCILYLVCILYPVFSLQSAVGILYWPDWYYCFYSSEPQVRTEILELKKKLLWDYLGRFVDVWTVCGGAHEEKYNVEQWLLYTNWGRTQMRGLLISSFAWSQRVLKWTRYGSPRCEHFGFLIQVAFSEVRKCGLRKFLTFNFFPWEFLSFIEINFDFH